ncbi:MAG TPA: cupin domain-containing protein [Phenylobacterium sp.]|nr:cupin domain-containing protein [Phenylobacterium sp.]
MRFGDSPPTHIHHEEDEIFHIIAGRMRLRVGDKELVGEAGDTLVAPKGVPHTFYVESAEARVINISTVGDFERMLRVVSRPAARDDLPEFAAVTPDLAERLNDAARANRIDIIGPPMAAP